MPSTDLPIFAGSVSKAATISKALLLKAAIAHQRPAEVAQADNRQRPRLLGAQNALDGVDQLAAAIADARIAELAEIGQVFADLGVGKSEHAAQLRRAGGFVAVADQVLQLAQVQAQPADDSFGNLEFARLSLRFVFAVHHEPD